MKLRLNSSSALSTLWFELLPVQSDHSTYHFKLLFSPSDMEVDITFPKLQLQITSESQREAIIPCNWSRQQPRLPAALASCKQSTPITFLLSNTDPKG